MTTPYASATIAAKNTIRKNFTPSEAVAIMRKLTPMIKAEAKERQRLSEGRGKRSAKLADLKEDGAGRGDARAIVAKRIGLSHGSLSHASKVVDAAEARAKEIRASGRGDGPHADCQERAAHRQRDQEMTMGRHERRADLARYRREAGNALDTYLVAVDQPLDLPILRNAARSWLDALPVRMRSCIVCSGLLWERQRVGLLLLSVPAVTKPPAASVCGICRECALLPLAALERAATTALQAAVPGGRLEPLDAP
jgi:hypothetical protein